MKVIRCLLAGFLLSSATVAYSASPAAAHPIVYCEPNELQLSEDSNAGGHKVCFGNSDCGVINLGNYSFHGTPWNDQVSSIFNKTNRTARFYNYKGSGDPNNLSNSRIVVSVNAGNYLRNLALDSSADGGTANDKIDIVTLC